MTYKIYENVKIGKNPVIEDFVIVGKPVKGVNSTVIGENAHLRAYTVIYAGNRIGNNFVTGDRTRLRENNSIGDNVSIGASTIIEFNVKIGNNVRIHSAAFIPEYTVLEDDCWIGPRVCITNAAFPKSPFAKDNLEGVVVRRGAKVGANATLLPGIVIGEHALVGAGAVVTKDVEPYSVVVGNPAKKIKLLKELKYKTGEQAYPSD